MADCAAGADIVAEIPADIARAQCNRLGKGVMVVESDGLGWLSVLLRLLWG